MSDCKVYLGNISEDTRERDVERFMKGYGKLRNIVLKGNYGFAEFEDRHDAQDAVKDLDGKTWMGARVRVEHAKDSRDGRRGGGRDDRDGGRRRGNPPGRRTGYRLLVENLSSRTSWQDLKDFMRQAGEITYTNTHHIRSGEGVVEFGSRGDMEWALDKLDDNELDGRRIRLIEENKGRSRSRSGGRSRSRSRNSRRRSGSRSTSRGRNNRSNSRNRSNNRSNKSNSRSRSRSVKRENGAGGRSRSRSR